jgi:uncharacterized membrane protein
MRIHGEHSQGAPERRHHQRPRNGLLNRGGFFYVMGLRSFFYSVPLIFWMFGPFFMIAGSVILVLALHLLDRAPRATIREASRIDVSQ